MSVVEVWRRSPRPRALFIATFILLVAAILRIYGFTTLSPPGLEHDEVANWLIDRSILDEGNYAIYYTAAYGHEAGFHYLQAASVALIGDNALALRLPAAFAGLLLVAANYALARRLFGVNVALMAAALLAVLFWPVFYSRLGLRAITLPLFSALSAYFWWRAWKSRVAGKPGSRGAKTRLKNRHLVTPSPPHPLTPSPLHLFTLSGFLAGLSLHTYMAARAVPIFYGLFIVYLALFHWREFKQRWRGVVIFVVVMTAVAAPLILYLQTHPAAEFRISEIDAPLQALKSGNWRPVMENSLKILGMFGFAGDPLWRQNVAGRPVFDPVIAALFYLSLPLCLWRLRDSRYAFLLLWLMTAVTPSIVTIDAPSTIRISNSLPVLTIFPAIVIHNSGQLSTVLGHLSTKIGRLSISLLLILLLYHIGWTTKAIFVIWPQNDEVQFVWQAAPAEAAAYLDASPDDGPVAIGGWTPGAMDPPTMALSLRRDDLSLRYFDPTHTLIIPAAAAGQTIRIIRPTILPLDPFLEAQLTAWDAPAQTQDSFTFYALRFPPSPRPQHPANTTFNNQLLFLGYNTPSPCHPLAPSPCHPLTLSPCHLVTYWQVIAPAGGPRRIFLHLVDEDGAILAQDDGLDAPATHWQPGDILLQHHTLTLDTTETAEPSHFRLGVYNPQTGRRLLTNDNADHIQLPLRNED